jgi:DcrB
MVRRRLIVVGAMMVVLGAAWGTWCRADSNTAATEPTSGPATASVLRSSPFASAKLGLSIYLPRGWRLKQAVPDAVFESAQKDHEGSFSTPATLTLSIRNQEELTGDTIDALVDHNKGTWSKSFPKYKKVSDQPITVRGLKGRSLEGTFIVQGLTLHVQQVWLGGTGKLYTLTCICIDSAWETEGPLFNASIGTFTVTTPAK